MKDEMQTWLDGMPSLSPHLYLAILTAIGGMVGYLYRHYGRQRPFDWARWGLEGLFCSFLGLGLSYLCMAAHASPEVAYFLGIFLSFMGTKVIAEFLQRFVQRRLGIEE